ncbi:putative 4-hydroxybenzoate polyprenyl transferase [Dictyocaulus viviparus]|uniref:Putative 4-hydroxybenzoate polyprenyl transferase n=1 Tax=Dictyocaulus viviparus TaxID=29172 RepID=A0A0D8XVR4_DICVI|nr:putative 4-hydroxybenzoate polyprenyl transferase [Dictyocaulus viviparus]
MFTREKLYNGVEKYADSFGSHLEDGRLSSVASSAANNNFNIMVERTKMRPLACGSLTQKQALVLLASLLCASFSVLMRLNWFSVAVGSASMLLVVGYPLAKRYTYWPQFILVWNNQFLRLDIQTCNKLVAGATLNWGVLIAWAEMLPQDQFYTYLDNLAAGLTFNWGVLLGWSAIRGSLSMASIALYLAALQWTIIYDTIYAHQDKTDDIMIGVKSTALRFGRATKVWLSSFSGITIAGLGIAGFLAEQTWPYYLSLAGTSAHLMWQVATVNIDDSKDCWRKFKSNQWIGVMLFVGIAAGTLLKEKKTVNENIQLDGFDES